MKYYESVSKENIEELFNRIDILKSLIVKSNYKNVEQLFLNELQKEYEKLANIYVEY